MKIIVDFSRDDEKYPTDFLVVEDGVIQNFEFVSSDELKETWSYDINESDVGYFENILEHCPTVQNYKSEQLGG